VEIAKDLRSPLQRGLGLKIAFVIVFTQLSPVKAVAVGELERLNTVLLNEVPNDSLGRLKKHCKIDI
jgi:hypothetical protein